MLPRFRSIALLGVGIHLLTALARSFPVSAPQLLFLPLLAALVLAVVAVAFLSCREATQHLTRNPDLLIPIGFFLLANTLLAGLAALPLLGNLLTTTHTLTLFRITYPLSLNWLLSFLVNTLFSGWMVLLLIQHLNQIQPDPSSQLSSLRGFFLRIASIRVIGSAAIYLALTLTLAFMSVLLHLGVPGGLIAAAVLNPAFFLYNAGFFFLMPAVLDKRTRFWPGLGAGFKLGLLNWHRIGIPLFLTMLLVGSICYFTYSSSFNRSNFNLKFHLFWIADFPTSTAWEGILASALKVEKLPLVSATLQLLLLILGVILTLELYLRINLTRWMEEKHDPTPPSAPHTNQVSPS